MSVDDVWGVEMWHMNQSELDTEAGSATKDKKSTVTKKKKLSLDVKETVHFKHHTSYTATRK